MDTVGNFLELFAPDKLLFQGIYLFDSGIGHFQTLKIRY